MDRKQRMNDLINELVTKKTTNKDCYVARIDGRLFETKGAKSSFKNLGQFKNALSASLMLSSNKGITANNIITELGNRLNWIKV